VIITHGSHLEADPVTGETTETLLGNSRPEFAAAFGGLTRTRTATSDLADAHDTSPAVTVREFAPLTTLGGSMKIGINVLNFGAGTTESVLTRWAEIAERGPFDFAMISDHVALTSDVTSQYPGPFWDPLTALAYFAGITNRIGLGTTVLIMPYRNPLLTARTVANIDRLSGGRMILGVGVGWARGEYEALGVEFTRRGEITDEYLDALRVLWGSDVASYHGKHVSFDEVDTSPRPLQRPHPPLWIGGSSDRALRRTVRYGAAWHPLRFPAGWLRADGLPRLQRAAADQQRAVPALAPRVLLQFTEHPMRDEDRATGQGTPKQIRADFADLHDLGATHVLIDTHVGDEPKTFADHENHWRALERFAELDIPT
jgi:probable F420-dependent oxidoreductase